MTKEEITAGLRNAIAKGESLESAMQSFISAGYSHDEVEQAGNEARLGMGVTGAVPQPAKPTEVPTAKPAAEKPPEEKKGLKGLFGIFKRKPKAEKPGPPEKEEEKKGLFKKKEDPTAPAPAPTTAPAPTPGAVQAPTTTPPTKEKPVEEPKKKKPIFFIVLIAILVLLLLVLGVSIFFGNNILGILFG